jgi:hypothetical protein
MAGRWGGASSRRRGRWATRSRLGFAVGIGAGAMGRRRVAARVRRERWSRRVVVGAVEGTRRWVARLVGPGLWDMVGLVLVDIGLGGVVGIGMGVCTLACLSRRTTC